MRTVARHIPPEDRHTSLYAAHALSVASGPALSLVGESAHAHFTMSGLEDIWVVGDTAAYSDADGTVLPMVKPVAVQQGRHVVRHPAAASRCQNVPENRTF